MKPFYTKLFIIIFFLNSFYNHAQDQIVWSQDYNLNWSDFQAEPNEDILAYALTATKIEISPEDVLVDEKNNVNNYKKLTVVAKFYKKYSWVLHKNEQLLKHEQLHFDIVELYARKIRKAFLKLQNDNIANFDKYQSIYNELYEKSRQMQRVYDEETNHGQDVEQNNAWRKKISMLLK